MEPMDYLQADSNHLKTWNGLTKLFTVGGTIISVILLILGIAFFG